MPIHDWSKVPPRLFHHFHQDWSIEIARTLNRGILPKGLYALVEQRVSGPEPDVIAVETKAQGSDSGSQRSTALLDRPKTKLRQTLESDAANYARRANRISIRHQLGEVVAVIEIVSPGNKSGRAFLRDFVNKAIAFLRSGIHLQIIDLFPPTPRDPQGIHKAIWEELKDEPFELPADQPLTLVSYENSDSLTAHIETAAVGQPLPDMPLFVGPGEHVNVPLESTYMATWEVTPEPIRELVQVP
jgi:hypothetical protein